MLKYETAEGLYFKDINENTPTNTKVLCYGKNGICTVGFIDKSWHVGWLGMPKATDKQKSLAGSQ